MQPAKSVLTAASRLFDKRRTASYPLLSILPRPKPGITPMKSAQPALDAQDACAAQASQNSQRPGEACRTGPQAASASEAGRVGRAERRAALRFAAELDALCVPADQSSFGTYPARVHDVSKTGVSLLVSREFAVATLLVMEIELGDGLLSRPLQARVIHSRPHLEDGLWLIGCEFVSPLTINELIMLV